MKHSKYSYKCTNTDIDELSDISQLQFIMMLGQRQGWCRSCLRPLGAWPRPWPHAQLYEEEEAAAGSDASAQEKEEEATGSGKTAELEEGAADSERSTLLEEVEVAEGGTEEEGAGFGKAAVLEEELKV